jgi:hypothetical protein
MKVSKCSESKASPVELLTFEQIKEQEGVYSSPDFCCPESTRLIVVTKDGLKDSYAILYYDGTELRSSHTKRGTLFGGDDA